MASFIAHGLVGIAAFVAFCRTKRAFIWLAIIGFFLGALPDILDWLLAILGLIPRWSLYAWFHHYMPVWMGIILLPAGLHVLMDKVFHKFPGYNWWPDLWYLEVSMWVIAAIVIAITYLRVKEKP